MEKTAKELLESFRPSAASTGALFADPASASASGNLLSQKVESMVLGERPTEIFRAHRPGFDHVLPLTRPELRPELRMDRILDEWAGRPDPSLLSPGALLHELFEASAIRHPERPAIICEKQTITYRELDARANRLARHLVAQGVRPGDRVGMLLPRGSEMYVSLLAAMKAGAAYVPLDPDYPAERVAYILSDCEVSFLLTHSECAEKAAEYAGPRAELDWEEAKLARYSGAGGVLPPGRLGPESLCYIIYTSGSTGRPKGVEIPHRAAVHLVRAENRFYGVNEQDRVYQGFSIAFDASVEEVWAAFYAGAALVVGTREWIRSGPELSRKLAEAGVTFFSTVPTMLQILESDIPTVRILILGGEACRPDQVERWARPGRRMFNTYGPTEATVIATGAECVPGELVTIGRPLPNYYAYILDENGRRVPPGTPGELYLGGVGLARGYVGRPDLTRERFVPNPFPTAAQSPRLYRTGDLVRFTSDGEIEFLGRTDTQVKIRGFRVELSEIESALARLDEVKAAVVDLRDLKGVAQLVAYVILRPGVDFDESGALAQLRLTLPGYMVPALIETVSDLPTLPSGKVDRSKLPAPRPRIQAVVSKAKAVPRNELERKLLDAFAAVFAPVVVGLQDDFFLDLGGHSLLAARVVSELRKDPQLTALSMIDVYNFPTIEKLAAELALRAVPEKAPAPEAKLAESARAGLSLPLRHLLCSAGQAIGLYFVIGIFSMQWLAPYLTYSWMTTRGLPLVSALSGAMLSLLLVYPVMLSIALAAKWLIIGRYRAGRYPLWGSYFFRWWLVDAILSTVPFEYLAGTPLLSIYYRLLGAKIGRNVHLNSDSVGNYDLIEIGDDCTLSHDASLLGSTVEDGELVLGGAKLGKGCFVGARAIVGVGASLGDGARLEDLSHLPDRGHLPAGETWRGSPAVKVESTAPRAVAEKIRRPGLLTRFGFGALQGLGVLAFPLFVIGAIFPGMLALTYFHGVSPYVFYLGVVPLVAASFVILLCLEIALVKWAVLGKVKPGTYSSHGLFYFRKWLVDRLLELSLDVVGPLYSTIYLAPWYRLLGAKLGRRAEISTACSVSPDLLTIEDEGFIADCVSLGAARVDAGQLTLAPTHIGKRSFIGNSALLPSGAKVGDNCLIGCLSTPAQGSRAPVPDDTSWLGSPGFFLPQRQRSEAFSEEHTFRPTRKLWVQRSLIELARVLLPLSGCIVLTTFLLSAVTVLGSSLRFWQLALLFPLIYAVTGMGASAFVIAMKWILMGEYKPSEQPLWSTFVWRTELLTALHENLSDLFFTNLLKGTPFVNWFFRLMGAKIGKRAYLETTCLTEFDLIEIGDDVALNHDATVQTHLFEDRVMKMGRIKIGNRCSVGALSLVLYDTEMGEGAKLGDLSLLMKREVLPAHTSWQGVPARRVR